MIQIKVNDIFLDLFGNEIFAWDRVVGEIGRIQTRQGNKSVNYKIPATKSNIAALEFVNELDFVGNVNPSKAQPTEILVRNTIVDKGIVQILEFDEQEKTIEIRYFSGNSLWFQDIKDKKLNDLNLSQWDHAYNKATILASFSNDEGYAYPLIDYGRLRNKSTNDIELLDWFPATFGLTVMRQMFEEIGYKIDGSFVDSPFAKKILLPFSNNRFFKSQEFIDLNTAIVSNTVGNPLQALPPDGNWYTLILDQDTPDDDTPDLQDKKDLFNTTTYRYVADTDLSLDISIDLIVATSGAATVNYEAQVFKNGTTQVAFTSGTINPAAHNNKYLANFTNISLVSTDFIEIRFKNLVSSSPGILQFPAIQTTPNSRIRPIVKFIPSRRIAENETINLAATLPNIKQTDFLKTIIFQFGILPITDVYSKKVTFIFFSDIKRNLSDAVNWSEKIDMSQSRLVDFTEIVEGYARVNECKYKDSSNDDDLINYREETKDVYGQGEISVDNDFLKDRGTLFESVFAGTFQVNSYSNLSTGAVYIPSIPMYEEPTDTEISVDPEPRIMFYLGQTDVASFSERETVDIDFTGDLLDNVPYAFFHKISVSTELNAFKFSMSFDQPKDGSAFGVTLLENFYPDYVKILQAPRFLKAFFNLDQVDMLNLDFSKPVYLNQYRTYFYINRIKQYRGDASTTEVELIRLI